MIAIVRDCRLICKKLIKLKHLNFTQTAIWRIFWCAFTIVYKNLPKKTQKIGQISACDFKNSRSNNSFKFIAGSRDDDRRNKGDFFTRALFIAYGNMFAMMKPVEGKVINLKY